jgi:hypothetical protein
MSTSGGWTAIGSLFNSSSNTNTYDRSVKASNSGSTFSGAGSSSSPFMIVIDLGQIRTFNHVRYYQMFSDGKTTHAALDISSDGNLNIRTSENWTEVSGFTLLDNSTTSTGVGVDFATQTARYIRLRIYNDGRYFSSSYTELYNFKLFNVPSATTTTTTAAPTTTTTTTSTTTTTTTTTTTAAPQSPAFTSTLLYPQGSWSGSGESNNQLIPSHRFGNNSSTYTRLTVGRSGTLRITGTVLNSDWFYIFKANTSTEIIMDSSHSSLNVSVSVVVGDIIGFVADGVSYDTNIRVWIV